MAEKQEKINGNSNGSKITLRDVDARLRKVEQRLAEQHGYQRMLVVGLQASVAINVASLGFVIGRSFG